MTKGLLIEKSQLFDFVLRRISFAQDDPELVEWVAQSKPVEGLLYFLIPLGIYGGWRLIAVITDAAPAPRCFAKRSKAAGKTWGYLC